MKSNHSRRHFGCKCLLFVTGAMVLGIMVSCFPYPLAAQEVTAGFTGTITDPSGAPIPDATVTAEDTLRGVPYTTKTNAVGVFDLPRIPVSTYDVTVEAKGFAKEVRRGIALEMNQVARLEIQMQLESVRQTVEVTSAPVLLSTDTMEVGTVI